MAIYTTADDKEKTNQMENDRTYFKSWNAFTRHHTYDVTMVFMLEKKDVCIVAVAVAAVFGVYVHKLEAKVKLFHISNANGRKKDM